MKQEELNQILENHRHWVKCDCDGWENMRANLHEANLNGASLCGYDLRGANLHGANLYIADLHKANLYGADLIGANLCMADLHEANLHGAVLHGANLHGAILYGADLHEANLYGANLYGVKLREADLHGANLHKANLCGVDLREAKNTPHIPLSCPSDVAFTAWKKAECENGDIIVKLEIPEDAKRSSATGIKCRCDKAKVLGFYDMDGNAVSSDMEVWSKYDKKFKYRIGEIVSVSDFDDNRFNECAPGIHFFVDRQSAIDYKG